jgi:rhamnosyltransferase subunit B
MRVLIAGLGSAGDVHPLLAIAQALAHRGHRVELISNPLFADLSTQLSLEFHPVGTAEQYAQTLAHPKLWHPVDGLGVMWRGAIRHAIRPVYEHIREAARSDKVVVLASPVMMGARLAREHLGIPLVTAYTAATMLRSTQDPLSIAQWRVPPWVPNGIRRAAWEALDRFKLEPMAHPALDAVRSELAMPPIDGSIFGSWMHSPDAGVTLFPAWFAPRASDWPVQVGQAGFPLFDADDAVGLEPSLLAFLDGGPRPVVVAPGTATVHATDFVKGAVLACQALGLRTVVLHNGVSLLPKDLPDSVYLANYAPFALLLPRARALIHHGGIGSCAQALRAGIPQVIVPNGYDQFDNAQRVEALRVGRAVRRKDLAGQSLVKALNLLLSSQEVKQALAAIQPRMDPVSARNQVCDVVERFQ